MATQEDPAKAVDAPRADSTAVEAVLGHELDELAKRAADIVDAERQAGAERPADGAPAAAPAQERMPSFSEQIAEQLGGWRGLVESSVPVVIFVLVNVVASLNAALIGSAAVAVGIAVWRLSRRQPVRHAVNGLIGIGIGAVIAWRTGEERDFYLPGILYGLAYGAALLASVALRLPLVGWIWSVLVAGGSDVWRRDPRLLRTFGWLTVLWGVVWIAKVGVQAALYLADEATALGVARLLLGYPPYALLLAITVWTVRRVDRGAGPPVTTPA
jgi:Protein of unknown function (DUF3159)